MSVLQTHCRCGHAFQPTDRPRVVQGRRELFCCNDCLYDAHPEHQSLRPCEHCRVTVIVRWNEAFDALVCQSCGCNVRGL